MVVNSCFLSQRLPETQRMQDNSSFPSTLSLPNKSLHERIISQIDLCETELDKFMPNFGIQNELDMFLKDVEEAFGCLSLKPFNDWICDNGNENWYIQFAHFLAMLPRRVAHNILHTLTTLIKSILNAVTYSAAHPLKAPLELAKWIVILANELSKPEMWSKIGVSMMGSNIGYAVITGNPISTLVLAIGGIMTIAGIGVEALKEAVYAETGNRLVAVRSSVIFQAQMIVEELTTGLVMGLIIGGIQQMIRGVCQLGQNIKYSINEYYAKSDFTLKQAHGFTQEYSLPKWDRFSLGDNSFEILWKAEKGQFVKFPRGMPGVEFVMKDVTEYFVTERLSHYITKTLGNGVVISEPVYEKIITPISIPHVGYRLPIVGWTPLPALPAITLSNIATKVAVPAGIAAGYTGSDSKIGIR